MSGGEILVRASLLGLGAWVAVDAMGDIAQADTRPTLERAVEANSRALEELSEETKRLRLEIERMRRECRK